MTASPSTEAAVTNRVSNQPTIEIPTAEEAQRQCSLWGGQRDDFAKAAMNGAITRIGPVTEAAISDIAVMPYDELLEVIREAQAAETQWVRNCAACYELVYNTERLKVLVQAVGVGRGHKDLARVGKTAFVNDAAKKLGINRATIYDRANLVKMFRAEISRDVTTNLMPISLYQTALKAKGQEREALARIKETYDHTPSMTVKSAKKQIDALRREDSLKQAKLEAAKNKESGVQVPDLIYTGACQDVIPALIDEGTLRENSHRFLFADWPYGINYLDGRQVAMSGTVCPGDESRDAAFAGFQTMLQQANRLMMDDAHGIFTTDFGAEPQFRAALEATGWRILNVLPWIKGNSVNPTGSRSTWKSNIEYVIHAARGKPAFFGTGNGVFNVPRDRNTDHLFEKPISLMRTFLEALTQPGELVIDPCCGSGSFVVAAVELGRHAIGIEIDSGHALRASNKVRKTQLKMLEADIGKG